MPIRISDNLPARQILEKERIFVMEENRALSQDIRALRLVILNLMPDKITTETQLLRALSNSPIQVDVEFLFTKTHQSKNTPVEHLMKFYKTFDEVSEEYFDGMIITGAPIEKLPFEEVDYWSELCEIMEWSKTHVYSTLHLCWGAFAGLYYHYGIPKIVLDKKVFGVFEHSIECGIYAVSDLHGRQFFITGHSEYDRDTLDREYKRDLAAGLEDVDVPKNYYINDDPSLGPLLRWRSSATLMYTNWLNYYVYQETPFDINLIRSIRNEDLEPNRDLEKNG